MSNFKRRHIFKWEGEVWETGWKRIDGETPLPLARKRRRCHGMFCIWSVDPCPKHLAWGAARITETEKVMAMSVSEAAKPKMHRTRPARAEPISKHRVKLPQVDAEK